MAAGHLWGDQLVVLTCFSEFVAEFSDFATTGEHPNPASMTFGDIFRVIIALFIPPLGVFTQVGLTAPFWINLVIYLFAVGGLGFPLLFGLWPIAVIHAIWVILTRK